MKNHGIDAVESPAPGAPSAADPITPSGHAARKMAADRCLEASLNVLARPDGPRDEVRHVQLRPNPDRHSARLRHARLGRGRARVPRLPLRVLRHEPRALPPAHRHRAIDAGLEADADLARVLQRSAWAVSAAAVRDVWV